MYVEQNKKLLLLINIHSFVKSLKSNQHLIGSSNLIPVFYMCFHAHIMCKS